MLFIEISHYQSSGGRGDPMVYPLFDFCHNATKRWGIPAISLCVRDDLCLTICFLQ